MIEMREMGKKDEAMGNHKIVLSGDKRERRDRNNERGGDRIQISVLLKLGVAIIYGGKYREQ